MGNEVGHPRGKPTRVFSMIKKMSDARGPEPCAYLISFLRLFVTNFVSEMLPL